MPQANAIVSDRKVAALRQAMGPVISQALSDRMVVEVMVNPDGKIWIDKIGEGRSYTGQNLAHDDADRILRLLADHAGEVVTRDQPRISATLPVTGGAVPRRLHAYRRQPGLRDPQTAGSDFQPGGLCR